MSRKERIITAITKKPYSIVALITFIIYLLINLLVNKLHITIATLNDYNYSFIIPFAILNIIVAILVAIAVALIYQRVKELQAISTVSGVTAIGIFGGMITGACPGCFVGLLPAIVGIFGGTFSLNTLPLHGIEIQLITTIILTIAIFYLSKENTCKIKK